MPTSHGGSSQQACISRGDGLGEETESWTETANPRVTWLSTPMNHPSVAPCSQTAHIPRGARAWETDAVPWVTPSPVRNVPGKGDRLRTPCVCLCGCVCLCERAHVCMHVHACACYMCACMGACVLKDVSHPFRDLVLAPASVSIEGGGRPSAGWRRRRAR